MYVLCVCVSYMYNMYMYVYIIIIIRLHGALACFIIWLGVRTLTHSPSAQRATREVSSLHNQSINQQSIKSSKRHTGTREATSQRNHTGSKPRDAKRRRLGGLRASRASVGLRDSLYVYTLFTEARENCRGKPPQILYGRRKRPRPVISPIIIHYPYRENRSVPYAQRRLLCLIED